MVTDVDDVMVSAAARRLAAYPNLRVERADVTSMPYPAETFDIVTSYLMLHHVIDWSEALAEAARVLRPRGMVIGYDLTDTRLARATHRLDGSPHRIIAPDELADGLANAGFADIRVAPSFRNHVMRFRGVKRGRLRHAASTGTDLPCLRLCPCC
ncbi:class I SAM-dependent methyltransferase [Nocardioides convexus]|uniref:class I SAM-dependent methyltransferase n=1 Tax=Nocardioides convexus TaxID=2712224 RepID=UPI0024187B7B|nr:class I SAM-dependent methyltransferase [Nocardioides convexus]